MEIAYLHLVTNHIPIIGVPFALAILLGGFLRNSDELKTAGFTAFGMLGLATVAVFLLGRGGEDFMEDLPGVSRDAIDAHEEFAVFALISMLLVGAAAVYALLRYRGFRKSTPGSSTAFPRWVVLLVVALGLASSAVLGYTGRLGGKIRHPEFHGAQVNGTEENDGGNGNDEENERGRNRRRDRGGS